MDFNEKRYHSIWQSLEREKVIQGKFPKISVENNTILVYSENTERLIAFTSEVFFFFDVLIRIILIFTNMNQIIHLNNIYQY